MCLAGAVVTCWSLTQEVTGSSHFNDNLSLSSMEHLGKASISHLGMPLVFLLDLQTLN